MASKSWQGSNTVTVDVMEKIHMSVGVADNYGYYLADDDGNVYYFDVAYLGDNTKNIGCQWRSKNIDFSDQQPQYNGYWFTIDRVRLLYKDMTADINIILHISNDGGETWDSSMRTIGEGDNIIKSADFFFYDTEKVTGQFFSFIIENPSADAEFVWTGLEIDAVVCGRHFEI